MHEDANTRKTSGGLTVISKLKELDDDRLEQLYAWVDEIPLSRPKKNMARDFADGVLLAEVIKCFLPKHVELHNYAASVGVRKNEANLYLLNRKVLPKLKLELSPDVIRAIAKAQPMAVENVLLVLRDHIDLYLARQQGRQQQPTWRERAGREDVQQLTIDDYLNGGRAGSMSTEGTPRNRERQKSVSWLDSLETPRKEEKIPRELLEEKEKEVEMRDQTIEMLHAKVQRLEHLCYLKDIRIEDIIKQTSTLENQMQESHSKAKLKLSSQGQAKIPVHEAIHHRSRKQTSWRS